MKKTIRDDIIQAFIELGQNCAHLSEIYQKVREIRERRGLLIGDFDILKAYIRWTLQNNSRGRGKNIFFPNIQLK
jgi:hypothetical protein